MKKLFGSRMPASRRLVTSFALSAALAFGCGGDPLPSSESDETPEPTAPHIAEGALVSGLAGSGLVLRTQSGEELVVERDGSLAFAHPVVLAEGALEIVSQPTSPSQTCTARIDAASQVRVTCETNRYTVGGAVAGLAGHGLVLESASGEQLAPSADGPFTFEERIEDLQSYGVRIVSEPTQPLQRCVVAAADGRIDGADVRSVVVSCTTTRFQVHASVAGLAGSGLELALAGETLSVDSDGERAFGTQVEDGSAYAVTIKRQPVSPAQTCVLLGGSGRIAGAHARVSVVCDALGTLRINEVGSCAARDTACWIELHNVGQTVENLSYYRLRTEARSAFGGAAFEREFQLPEAALYPGDYLVLRGRSTYALPDGGGVVHVGDASGLPYWDDDGFVELLNGARTVDFVRFGDSTAAPRSPEAWQGGAAPELSTAGFGYGLGRSEASDDGNQPADWRAHAFATPGGPNDVDSDLDVDQDGIPDSAEVPGGTYAGLDLHAMGARVGPRDLFIEIDRMDSTDPAVIPRREALAKVVSAFAARQIAVHFDVGNLYAPTFDPAQYNLGGGNVVPFSKGAGIAPSDPDIADVYDYKAGHMSAARRSVFYYMLFAWSQNEDGSRGSSGVGELSGNDTVITLGGLGLTTNGWHLNVLINLQALTIMHELGHNLGLTHGGSDGVNFKPNYVSIMNYLYSLGLPAIGAAEGDRYDYQTSCSLESWWDLTRSPLSDPADFIIDYSDGISADLDELAVLESEGIGRGPAFVDYNCNGQSDPAYARDINFDGAKKTLVDHDDWSNLDFFFRRGFQGHDSGPYLLFSTNDGGAHDHAASDDVQPSVADPCPVPAIAL